eukprot:1981598-Pleurochrysis_carterae.AAC.1
MVQGTAGLPGGISAWLPTACFIIINAHLEARIQASRTGKSSDEVSSLRQRDLDAQAAAASVGASSSDMGREGYGFEPNSDDELACGDPADDAPAD